VFERRQLQFSQRIIVSLRGFRSHTYNVAVADNYAIIIFSRSCELFLGNYINDLLRRMKVSISCLQTDAVLAKWLLHHYTRSETMSFEQNFFAHFFC